MLQLFVLLASIIGQDKWQKTFVVLKYLDLRDQSQISQHEMDSL